MSLSPDGRRGYVSPVFPLKRDGRTECERLVFDPDTGKRIASNTSNDGSPVLLAYPDNTHMLSVSDKGMSVWDEKFSLVGLLVRINDSRPGWTTFRSVVISPSGRLVAWCGSKQLLVASARRTPRAKCGTTSRCSGNRANPSSPQTTDGSRWVTTLTRKYSP